MQIADRRRRREYAQPNELTAWRPDLLNGGNVSKAPSNIRGVHV